MITGQDAEATGVDRQHFSDPELHREVPDALRQRRLRAGVGGHLLVPQRLSQIFVQIGR